MRRLTVQYPVAPVPEESPEPIDLDPRELAKYPRDFIFTLGVEWHAFFTLLMEEFSFEMQVHSENRKRIIDMIKNNKRDYQIAEHDDYPLFVVAAAPDMRMRTKMEEN